MNGIVTAPSGSHPEGRKVWLRWAVLCDSQRREDNGKRLLVGVYDHTILSSKKPAFIAPKLVGAFEVLERGKHTLYFRISSPNGTGIASITTHPDSEPGGYVDFEVSLPMLVRDSDSIELDWRVDDDHWGPAMAWQIEFAPDAEELSEDEIKTLEVQADIAGDPIIRIGGRATKTIREEGAGLSAEPPAADSAP